MFQYHSKLINKYRHIMGYSDEQLSNLTGIPLSIIKGIMSGLEVPTLKELTELSVVMKVPLEYLLDETKEYKCNVLVCYGGCARD